MPAWKIQSLRSDYVARLHRETLKMVSESSSDAWVQKFLGVHASIVASGAALVPELPVTGERPPAPPLIDSFLVRGPRSLPLAGPT